MLSRIHNKLGTAGLVVAIVALVAALTGAAFAAGGLTPQQEKQVKKIAKKYAGKNGKNGATGPAGPQGTPGSNGTNGAPGAPGATGATGATGKTGTNGTNGKNVVVGTEAKGANCAEGGVNVEVEGSGTKKFVCNGLTGFTSVLPKGKTETGLLSVSPSPVIYEFDGEGKKTGELTQGTYTQMSFNIPLTSKPSVIIIVPGATTPTFSPAVTEEKSVIPSTATGKASECTGTIEAPTAPEGKVCVYLDLSNGATIFRNAALTKLTPSGVSFFVLAKEGQLRGTWAVTGN